VDAGVLLGRDGGVESVGARRRERVVIGGGPSARGARRRAAGSTPGIAYKSEEFTFSKSLGARDPEPKLDPRAALRLRRGPG
jgi:hypothetical protein